MHSINVNTDGTLAFVWDDALAPLLGIGRPNVRRASHVEPNENGRWTADLSPVGGPVLGEFLLRGDALAAEREWLERHPESWAGV